MYVNGTDHCALFGNALNASIKNLTMANAYVKATGNYAGALLGYSMNASIIHCSSINGYVYASGNIECTGGLAGYVATMTNCFATGFVHGHICVGGLAGNGVGECTDCTNECTVEGAEDVGGIAGLRNATDASLIRCINYGTIIGISGHSTGFGGIVGITHGKLIDCVSDCQIRLDIEMSSAGALAGASDSDIQNCTAMVDCNVQIYQYQGTAWSYKNPTSCYSQVNSTKTYSAGDFSGWSVVPNMNGGLPVQKELYWPAVSSSQTINSSFWSSKGFTYRAI